MSLERDAEVKTDPPKRVNWRENYGVKEVKEIMEVDRLKLYVGVNEYKGELRVFIAKVSDKDFCRQFFAMPASVWQKALPVVNEMCGKVSEIEKQIMIQKFREEVERLKSMGIDVSAIIR